MKKMLFTTLLACASVPLFAQPKPADLGIDGVVKMVHAGLSDDIVIARLQRDGKAYDLTPDDMVKLKGEHVSDNVLKIMLDPHAALSTPNLYASSLPKPTGATPASGAIAGDPNNPSSPHDSGIYLYTSDREGKPLMTLLERADYQGSKMNGMFTSALTYGIAKVKTKAVIPGAHAGLRTDENPVFYFYFDDKAVGLGKGLGFGGSRLSSPKQFALLKLSVNSKDRETVIGSFGITGGTTGTDTKDLIPFTSSLISPGIYRVTLNKSLEPGEYCFIANLGPSVAMASGSAGMVDIFDFGFSPEKKGKHK
jgi:hypothetical protein